MRDLMRSVAKANMRAAGVGRLCKGGIFRRSWREWVFPSKQTKRAYRQALREYRADRKRKREGKAHAGT